MYVELIIKRQPDFFVLENVRGLWGTKKHKEFYDRTEDEKVLFDWLKKYKLASSEGLNKHTNRMIRYNVMKDFLFGMTDNLVAAADTLYNKMLETSIAPSEDPEE